MPAPAPGALRLGALWQYWGIWKSAMGYCKASVLPNLFTVSEWLLRVDGVFHRTFCYSQFPNLWHPLGSRHTTYFPPNVLTSPCWLKKKSSREISLRCYQFLSNLPVLPAHHPFSEDVTADIQKAAMANLMLSPPGSSLSTLLNLNVLRGD